MPVVADSQSVYTNRTKYIRLTTTFHLTLKMTSAQVVETSVTSTDNSPSQDYTHPDDQTTLLHVTPGFKPFTVRIYSIKKRHKTKQKTTATQKKTPIKTATTDIRASKYIWTKLTSLKQKGQSFEVKYFFPQSLSFQEEKQVDNQI